MRRRGKWREKKKKIYVTRFAFSAVYAMPAVLTFRERYTSHTSLNLRKVTRKSVRNENARTERHVSSFTLLPEIKLRKFFKINYVT